MSAWRAARPAAPTTGIEPGTIVERVDEELASIAGRRLLTRGELQRIARKLADAAGGSDTVAVLQLVDWAGSVTDELVAVAVVADALLDLRLALTRQPALV